MRPHLLRAAGEDREAAHLRRALGAADAAERAVRAAWVEFLAVLRARPHPVLVQAAAARLLRAVPELAARALGPALAQAADQAHADTARDLAARLPAPVLRAVHARRSGRLLFEDTSTGLPSPIEIFPAPARSVVDGIVYRSGWRDHFGRLTALAAPEALAAQVAQGAAAGETPAQLAKRLLPHVQGVQASARRIARTEGLRVAHEVQLAAYEELGDLVVGYEIHATLDGRTRPEHRARDGTRYYKRPRPGQLSVSVMPRPPLEADGRPAFNCRCWLSPILGEI